MGTLTLVISGLTLGSIYALVALGFHLVYRMTGIIDFAQGDKVVVGGLIGLTLVQHGLPAVALVLVIVVAAGLALGALYDTAVILPTQRNGLIAAVAATVGITLVFANGHQLIWGPDAQPFPALVSGQVTVGRFPLAYQTIAIWVILIAAGAGLSALLHRSRVGRGMVAAATDPLAATAAGINVARTRVIAFALAFGLATLAGVLVAPITLAGGAAGTSLTLKGFTGAILGGLDSAQGVIAGSLLLGVAESLIGGWLPNGDVDPVVFAGLIIVLLLMPSGLLGLRRQRLA